ncbi:MAG: hypothetical protein ACFFBR_03775 [Promethearchaeota archaeon]
MMISVLQAFTRHTETVRDYIVALFQVDSGIYNVDQLKTILQEPDTTVRLETEWLQSLLKVLLYVQQYTTHVQKWVNHTLGLLKNLGANQRELHAYENRQITASQILQKKQFDQNYLRWVLEDAAQEVDRLIVTAHQLINDYSFFSNLIERFGGPFLSNIEQIASAWEANARRDFFVPLSTILQEIDTQGDPSITLQQFARYLDTIAQVVSVMPMFVTESDGVSTYSPEVLKMNQRFIAQLIDGIEHLRQFVQLRSQVYSILINEQSDLWNAVLPKDTPVEQILVTIGLNPAQTVEGLIPNPFPVDTLPLAFQQAEEALAIWESTINASIPYLNKALILNQILQSPAIAKFLKADQRRLELYHEWHPRITETFKILQKSL